MKITMYELLRMIKDGNVPKRIIYDQFVYVWNSKIENYQREVDEITTLNWDYIAINCLNEPVEILNKSIEEEKKIPKKLPLIGNKIVNYPDDEFIERLFNLFYKFDDELRNKINEIIDYLKSKGE